MPATNNTPACVRSRGRRGLVGRLLVLPAFTGEGLQAKAAAVCALEDAGGYSNRYRDDAFTLWETVVRDAAGAAYRPLGEAWKE